MKCEKLKCPHCHIFEGLLVIPSHLDEGGVSEIRHVPSDGGVVNVHEEIVLVHVHGELEPLDQLLVAHQVVEEPAGEVPHCLAVLSPHLNMDWPCAVQFSSTKDL